MSDAFDYYDAVAAEVGYATTGINNVTLGGPAVSYEGARDVISAIKAYKADREKGRHSLAAAAR